MYAYHVYAVPMEAQRGLQMSWNWMEWPMFVSCLMWALGTEFKSSMGAASALHCWAITLAPAYSPLAWSCFSPQQNYVWVHESFNLLFTLRSLEPWWSQLLGLSLQLLWCLHFLDSLCSFWLAASWVPSVCFSPEFDCTLNIMAAYRCVQLFVFISVWQAELPFSCPLLKC